MRASLINVAALFLLPLLGGCTHYEYELIAPPELAGHIGEKNDYVFPRAHLVFRLRSVEDYLVIRIENPGNDPARLIGGQSVLVDPTRLSHPLADRMIAPHSWIKLILPPPPPPVVYAPGPAVTLGFGFGGPGWYSGFSAPIATRPRPLPAFDAWPWEDGTDVQLSLAIQYGGDPIVTEDFVFRRRRMN